MKVFEVRTERCEGDSKEIIETVIYVTSSDNELKTIVDHYVIHCNHYEMDLKGVREVLTVAHRIEVDEDIPF